MDALLNAEARRDVEAAESVRAATQSRVEVYGYHDQELTTLQRMALQHGARTPDQTRKFAATIQQLNPEQVPQRTDGWKPDEERSFTAPFDLLIPCIYYVPQK